MDTLTAAGDFDDPEYTEAVEDFVKYDAVTRGVFSGLIEDADYFKIREVSVSYNVAPVIRRFLVHFPFRRIDLTVSGSNLFTRTPYSGPDPEVSAPGAISNTDDPTVPVTIAQDFMTLQHPKTVMFSIQFGL